MLRSSQPEPTDIYKGLNSIAITRVYRGSNPFERCLEYHYDSGQTVRKCGNLISILFKAFVADAKIELNSRKIDPEVLKIRNRRNKHFTKGKR